MPTIIKAADRHDAVRHVAFNFHDMAALAQQQLEQIRAQAAEIVARARQEADAIRQHAEAEGRRAGQGAVAAMAQSQAAHQVATLLPALAQAAAEIQQAKSAWLAHWEKAAVHAAVAIAERVIRRELSRQPEIPVALVREALELAAGSPELRIHLHPHDHRTLGSQIEAVVAEIAPLAAAELIADAEITPGGCRVETRFGTIDQQFESQLARIEEEL